MNRNLDIPIIRKKNGQIEIIDVNITYREIYTEEEEVVTGKTEEKPIIKKVKKADYRTTGTRPKTPLPIDTNIVKVKLVSKL